jgi:hypothetical protein
LWEKILEDHKARRESQILGEAEDRASVVPEAKPRSAKREHAVEAVQTSQYKGTGAHIDYVVEIGHNSIPSA